MKKFKTYFTEMVLSEGKISGDLYKRLETACKSVIKSNGYKSFADVYSHYKKMGIGKDPALKARWDIFNAIDKNVNPSLINDLYKIGNDDHIDTALKTITGINNLKEAVGTMSHIVWYGTQAGKALLKVPKREYDKDSYAASLTVLKFSVRSAKALTKVVVDSKTAGEYYSVTVDFTTRGLQREETKSGPPTNSELTKNKQEREKEDLKKRQENEAEKAREQDFRKKEADRRKQIQQKDAQARSKKLGEVLEVGTDETTSTFKKFVPGQ